MVLALECKPGQAEAVKGVNLADQCLYWCAEKLAMHLVPAAVVVAEVPDDETPLATMSAEDLSSLFSGEKKKNEAEEAEEEEEERKKREEEDKHSYPWEMHSLLSATGWHLKQVQTPGK